MSTRVDGTIVYNSSLFSFKKKFLVFLIGMQFLFIGLGCEKQDSRHRSEKFSAPSGIIGAKAVGEDLANTVMAIYDSFTGSLCSASLLPGQTLITAAHCIRSTPRNIYVLMGKELDNGTAERLLVDRIVVHPKYNPRLRRNRYDLALVHLKNPPPEEAHEMKLPVSLEDQSMAFQSQIENVHLAGFGVTAYGNQDSGSLRITSQPMYLPTANGVDFEIDASQGRSTCVGDSGGPLFVERNGEKILFGITSAGRYRPGQDPCEDRTIITNVSHFVVWIEEVTAAFQIKESETHTSSALRDEESSRIPPAM